MLYLLLIVNNSTKTMSKSSQAEWLIGKNGHLVHTPEFFKFHDELETKVIKMNSNIEKIKKRIEIMFNQYTNFHQAGLEMIHENKQQILKNLEKTNEIKKIKTSITRLRNDLKRQIAKNKKDTDEIIQNLSIDNDILRSELFSLRQEFNNFKKEISNKSIPDEDS